MALAENAGTFESQGAAAGGPGSLTTIVGEPVSKASQRERFRWVRRGTRIFDASGPYVRIYRVAAGEVLILRGGWPVDLVEAGEMLDPRMWQDATAIAYTDCTLSSPRSGL